MFVACWALPHAMPSQRTETTPPINGNQIFPITSDRTHCRFLHEAGSMCAIAILSPTAAMFGRNIGVSAHAKDLIVPPPMSCCPTLRCSPTWHYCPTSHYRSRWC